MEKRTALSQEDLEYLCRTVASLCGLPIRAYKGQEQAFFFSVVPLEKDPFAPYLERLESLSSPVTYIVTPRFLYYGIVTFWDLRIVLGPSRNAEVSEEDLRSLSFELDVPSEKRQDFYGEMRSLVPMPLDSLLQVLFSIHFFLSGEKLSLSEVVVDESSQKAIQEKMEHRGGEKPLGQEVHNTYGIEQQILSFVEKGDPKALSSWLSSAPAVRSGPLSRNALRNLKNTFIVTAALVSRAAIRGGLSIEESFRLSDLYIQEAESLSTQEGIANLHYRLVVDYAERVGKLRLGKSPSKLLVEVSRYVQGHLHERIEVEGIAKAVYLSRSQLSARFKKESGMSLGEFIAREKTEEAKRLLRYGDKPISQIAEYLGYSSQSHFSTAFRDATGLSPKEYRASFLDRE